MPIYSYAQESLGLELTPRMEDILKQYHENETPISREDIGYLIDEAARWYTFEKEVGRKKGVEIDVSKGEYGGGTISLGEIIHDLVQETSNLEATKLYGGNVYYLDTKGIVGYYATAPVHEVAKYFRRSVQPVRELQKDFDKLGKKVTVVGHLGKLKDDKLTFKVDTPIEKVIHNYYEMQQEELNKTIEKDKQRLKEINKFLA